MAMWTAVFVLLLASSVLGSCPDKCTCPEAEDDILFEVNCKNASLTDLPVGDLQETFFIDLSVNNITVLKNDAFKQRNWLKIGRLYLEQCGMKTIEEQAFRGLTQLKILNLGSNLLTKLPADVFATNTELEALSMNGNRNLQLPETGFNLPNLDILSMKDCGLTKIPIKFFQNLTRLQLVLLQGNELSSFDPQLVSPLTQLRQLDLRRNLFTSLPVELDRVMPQTLLIRVEGNPFKCACAMAAEFYFYQSRHFHEQLMCLDPPNTTFDEFVTFRCNKTEPETSPTTATVTTAVTTVPITVTTVPISVTTTVETGNDTTTTSMPVPGTAWHPWWVGFGVTLAVFILIILVYLVIKKKTFVRGYITHRTFTVLDDEEEQNFIT